MSGERRDLPLAEGARLEKAIRKSLRGRGHGA